MDNADSGGRRAERRRWSSTALLCAAGLLLTAPARADWATQTPATVNSDYTSIVVDTNTYPHIAYRDSGVDEFYIADWNGTSWAVSQPDTTNNRGIGARLAIDRGGNLHASYQMTSPKGQFYAKRTGATWGTAIELQTSNLSINAQSCIAVSSSSAGAFVHVGWTSSGDMMYAKSVNGGTSFAAQSTVDAPASVTVGDYCAMASTGASVHVSYYDTTNGDLKYAYINGTSITVSTVDTTGVVGSFTSIALDASTRPHISYYDTTNGALKHAYKSGGTWVIETVDTTGDTGQYTSMVISSMSPRIAYYDVTNANLMYAEYTGAAWTTETADSPGDMGKFASLALDTQGQLHSAHIYWISSSSANVRYGLRAPTPNCDNIASAGTGNWSLASTWAGGLVPTSCNRVTVGSGHTVTVDVTTGAASATTLNGTLSFRRTGHSKLVVTGGDVTVAPGGLLDLGTEASPIPVGSTATLTLASGTSAGLWGLVVQDGGVFTARGATKTPFGYALASLAASDLSLSISASSSTNWSVGDTIVIGPTSGNGTSTAEERVITALTGTDPRTVSWSGGLSNAHTRTDDTPVFVANVSRNVVVLSSGASAGEASYVRSLVTSATSFTAAHAEFAGLGANSAGRYGVTLDGAFAQGTVSSSAFRGGYQGLRLDGGFSATVVGALLYKNSAAGLHLADGGAHAVSESLAVANSGAGFSLSSSSGTSFAGVRAAANGGSGFLLDATASDISISSSASHDNASHGVSLAHANAKRLNLGVSSVYANGGDGLNVSDAADAAVSESNIFSNTGAGFYACGATASGHYVLAGALGHDGAGNSKANGNGEVRACGTGGVKVQINQAKVNAAGGGIVATSFCAGDQASSYNENGVTGSARVYGDYQVPAASTFTMHFQKRTNAPAYTGPTAVKGKDHTLTSIVVTTKAVNELFKIVNVGGNSWTVTGQKSGQVGTITCAASASCAFFADQVSFNLVTGSTIKAQDRVHLVTHRPSNDAGGSKAVKLGRACPTFNGGNSKFTVPAGGGVELVGVATAPTTIATLDASATYFSFVASGAFTMDHASVTRADREGLHLSGGGPIHLSSAAFDDTGATDTPGCSHLTFQSMGITASFPGVYVGNRSACSAMKGIKVLPGSCSGSVSFAGMTGPLGGPDNVDDAACPIAVSGGPFIPGSLSSTFTAVNVTSVTARWGSNGNPAQTQYTLQASTAANFTGTLASSVTYSTAAAAPGLTPNTTYFFRVYATTVTDSDYRSLGSTATFPAVPGSSVQSVTSGTAVLDWATNSNPAVTLYAAQLSTAADFTGTVTSSTTLASSATFAGLAANTTYYLRVKARGHGEQESPYDSTRTTATDVNAPTGAAVSAVTPTTSRLGWAVNSNPAGTLFAAQLSTASNFTGTLASSQTYGTDATFTGLTPNTTYYLRVKARGHGGAESAYNVAAASATEANAPTVPAVTSTSTDTVVFGWNPNSNPGGTRYLAHLSTASNFTGTVTSSETSATEATFPGLANSTTYYLRVRARGVGGSDSAFSSQVSTKTAGGTFVPVTPAVTAAAATSLSYSWGDGGNAAGTQYRALLSTASNFSGGGDASSDTLNTTAVFASLAPNTTFYFKVKALGSPDSAFTTALTSSTLANAPVTAAVSSNTPTTAQLGWGANSNPADTVYTAEISAQSSFSPLLASSATYDVSALFTGLTPNTTYYLRVKAAGRAGVASAYAVAPASATAANTPENAAVQTVGNTGLRLLWEAASNPAATQYEAHIATGSDFTGTVTSSRPIGLFATFTGLTANTSYYLRVRTLGFGGTPTAFASTVSSFTTVGAAMPSPPSVTLTAATALSFVWSDGINAAGTQYRALLSTTPAFTGGTDASSDTLNLDAAFTGLSVNTTYYFKVKALGGGGPDSAYTATLTTSTLANVPLTAAVSAVTPMTAQLGWAVNSNPPGTSFLAELSAASDFSGTPASSRTLGTQATFTGLTANTTYYLRVKALGHGGNESAFAVAAASATDTNAPMTAAVSAVTPTTAQLGWAVNSNPAGTLFAAQASTAANFTGTLASSQTLGTQATFTGLTANTTYYLRVKALGHGGAESAYAVAAASATEPNAPTSPVILAMTATTVQGGWSANSNPPATLFLAQLSTASNFTGTVSSSQTVDVQALFSGLAGNTTYYLRARTVGHGSLSAFSANASTFTTSAALLPVSAAVTAAAATSLSYSWADGGNAAGTQYRAVLSTASNFSGGGDGSSDTLNLTAVFSGLTANTTYYFKVKALGGAGPDSAFTTTLTSSTLANVPVTAAVSAVTPTTAQLGWGVNSNPPGTLFAAQLSTAANFSGTLSSSQTLGTSALFSGLTANTTYYLRVKALGHGGAESAYATAAASATNTNAPVTAAVSAVTAATAQLGWGENTNPAGTLYAAQLSTASNFSGTLSSSQTLGTSALFSGLTANTTYYLRVKALGHGGAESAYAVATASATEPNAPTSPNVLASSTHSAQLGWSSNSNPPGTLFAAQLSTASNFSGTVSSSQTLDVQALFAGLAGNTTYYLRVRTVGHGSLSVFSANASTFTTSPALLPVSAAVTAAAATSLSYSWADGGNAPGTQYRALVSTASNFSGGTDASSDTLNLTASFSGLTANTTYYFKVKALGGAGPDSAFTSALTSSTLANAPVTAAVSAVTPTTAQLGWGVNSNPPGTLFAAQLSTASNFSGTLSSSQTLGTSALFSGLTANTTYYLRVKTLGHGGAESAYAVASASATDNNAPVTAAVSAVTPATAQLGWGVNSNPPGTLFAAQLSTAANFSGTLSSSQTLGNSALFSGLTANTTYYLRVKALGHGGAESAFAVAAASATDTNAPTAANVLGVSTNSAQLGWSANSNPPGTLFSAQLSTASNFTGTVSSSQTLDVQALFTGLANNTTYYLHVRALGHGGSLSAFSGTVSTFTTTGALAPVTPTVTLAAATSLSYSWGNGGNAAGTQYRALVSTTSNFSGGGDGSSDTLNTTAVFSGLIANTTYYFKVKALGGLGPDSAFTTTLTSSTLANAPITAAVSAVTPTTAQLGWAVNSNPPGTLFAAQLSTASTFSGTLSSSQTLGTSALFSGLAANTTYYLRVKALGHGGAESAYAVAPASATDTNAPLSAAVSAVSAATVQLGWDANANPAGTVFAALISTASNFTGTLTSSQTVGTSALFAGLAANTTYYLRVRALGHGGAGSAYAVAAASATDTNAPTSPSVLASSTNSAQLGWSANSNPPGTAFNAQLSTASNFTGTVSSSQTVDVQALFTGLANNTTYYLRARAVGHGGSLSAFSGTVSTFTTTGALAPVTPAVTLAAATSLSYGWGGGGNSPGTQYRALVSTAFNFGGGADASSDTLNLTASFSGLTANTTYYFKVKALGGLGPDSAFTATLTSSTLANAPVTAAVSAVTPTTAQLGWGVNSNPPGTLFAAQLSTASNFSGTLSSSRTVGTTALFSGLTANTTYYLRVKALGHGGNESAYAVASASATDTNAPTSPNVPASSTNSAQLGWSPNSNPAGTLFNAQLSTASNFTGTVSSSQTVDVAALFTGLANNTTYYLRARTVGHGGSLSAFSGTVSTFTTTGALAPVTPAVTLAAATSLSYSWGNGGNAPGTPYRALVSTASNFSGGGDGSSDTLNTTAVFSGLTANTTYYFKVKALGGLGPDSAFTATLTSSTLANAPVTAAVSAVTPTTAQLGWGVNSNPPGTLFAAQLSTASNFTGTLSSSRTLGSSALFSGLTANTTYYLRVKALGHGGAESAYAVASASATDTNAPVTAAVSAVTAATAQLGWGDNANPAGTLYAAQLSTASNFTGTLSSSRTLGTSALFSGLAANTTYYLRVKALGHGGAESAYAAASASATNTNAPVTAAVSAVTPATAQLGWGDNANPAGTLYAAQLSTASNFTGTLSSSQTLGTSALFSGLTANTTYYLRVKALGHGGAESAYAVAAASATDTNAPVTAAASAVSTGTARLGWGDNANPAGTLYAAEVAAAADFSAVLASSRTSGTSALFSGLTPNTTYHLRVRALGHGAGASAYAVAAASATDANVPANAAVQTVGGTGLRLLWEAAANPEGTLYDARLSTALDFGGTLVSSRTAGNHATFSALTANTTYYLRVRTLGFGGTPTAFGTTVSSFTTVGAAMPSPPSATSAAATALDIAWTDGINAAGTRYRALLSTAPGFGGGADASSDTLNLGAAFTGLSVNTTYYFKVKALGGAGPDSAYTAAAASATLANAPLAAAVTAVGTTTAQLNWAVNSNPAGTPFIAELSAAADFAGTPASSRTFGSSAQFSGLTPNTTYYLRVRALGHGGALTAFSVAAASATGTNAPLTAAVTAVATTTARFGWAVNSNPPGTLFAAQLSTASDFSGTPSSSRTSGTSALFSGLTANTTYYLRVKALGHGGAESAYAVAAASATDVNAPTSANVLASSTNSAQLGWNANSNPAGTVFSAEASTAANFTGTLLSSRTVDVGALFSGLANNTTYYLRARALGHGGSPSAFSGTVSTFTMTGALAPVTPAVTLAAATSLSYSWGNGSNAPGTQYRALVSTASNFSGGGDGSSDTLNLTAVFSGLTANTTYYFKVKALGGLGPDSAYTTTLTSSTLVNVPLTAAVTAVTTSTARLGWGANANPGGTLFAAHLSAAADFSGPLASSLTYGTSALFSGLTPNATYYLRVRAQGHGGGVSAFAVAPGSATEANVPADAAVQTVGGTGLRLLWGAASNLEGSRYDANLSTAADFSGTLVASRTAALHATFSALTANTTYYLRVRTLGFGGTPTAFGGTVSSFTTVGAAIPSPPAASLSTTTALDIGWSDGINAPGTQYRALVSTASNFSGGADASSDTLNLSAAFNGLSVNTTYYFKVKALGGAGPDSAYTAAAASATSANAPLAAAVTAVGTTTAQLNWAVNSNPAGTPFIAELSAAADFAGTTASSRTFGSTALFSGLTPNATYYLRVRALGHGGALTAFSVAPATATRPNPPSGPSAADRTGSSLRWTWNAEGDAPGTLFAAELAADPAFGAVTAASSTFNAEATFTGLTSNTTYYLRARALGRDGAFSAYSATAAAATRIGGPASPAAFRASTEALTFVWSANGDPAGTRFRAEVSTAADFSGAAASVTVAEQASYAGLAVNTTHHFRVKALGNDGTDSAYTGTVSSATLAVAPTGTALTSGSDGTLQMLWSAGPNPAGTRYLAERAAAADFSGTPASSATTGVVAAFSGLTPNTTYYLRVRAVGHGGTATAADTALVAVTSAAVPGTPTFSGTGLSTMTVSWGRSANPGDTAFLVQLSPAADFSGTPAERTTVDASAQFTGLSEHTTYYARVRAGDRAGRFSAFSATASARTTASPATAPTLKGFALSSTTIRWQWTRSTGVVDGYDFWTSSGVLLSALGAGASYYLETGLVQNTAYLRYVSARNSGGSVASSTITVATPVTYDLGAGVSSGTVSDPVTTRPALEIPAGVTNNTMRWLLSTNPPAQPLTDETPALIRQANAKMAKNLQTTTAQIREYLVTINEERFRGNFSSQITIVVPYPDADRDGFVDGTAPPVAAGTLRLYILNEDTSVWEEVPGFTLDTANRELRAKVSHLSIYASFGVGAAATTGTVTVYPNPWQPRSGGAFDAAGVKFDNLTAQATIKIFTVTGDLVRRLDKAPADGNSKLWDGRNDQGERVANGVYLYFIKDSGGGTVTGRLAVLK